MNKRSYSLRILFVFICFVTIITRSYSQSIGNYSNSRTTGISYSSISSTGNAIASWRNNGSFSQDDNRSNLTDIGFDFWYNGTRYTQFSVSTNGFVDFSSSLDDGGPAADPYGYSNPQFTANGSGTWLALAPFYDDMTAQGGTSALGNSIKYLTTGTSPNRVLTIEWIDMAVYLNTSPSLNFQLKLYETTGVIEFVYGTMTQGTHSFSYTCGINAATLSNTPTVAQLKTQQTANSNTFNNTEQNGLVTLPANNSRITFTPPATTPSPSGAITFSGISTTGMTVNWTNWCTNEVGYVLYSSEDNINFNFVVQRPANSTNYVSTGLLPSTLYYWRLYAVTDGALSSFLTNSQSTTGGVNKISSGTGNWNTAGSWIPSGVPTLADNVTIANGHTITINSDIICNALTVGQGTSGILRIGNNSTTRTLQINSTITINNGGTFDVSTTSNTTHGLTFRGNIINNGILNFATDGTSFCNVTFNRSGNQTITGTGAVTNFNIIRMDLGTSASNTLDISSTNFSAVNNFLTLANGTFKLSTTGVVSLTPFTGTATIPLTGGIHINSTTATVSFLAGINLFGNLTLSNGNLNIGNANNEDLISNGGYFQIAGGTARIAGKYYSANINTLTNFSITGGSLILPTSGTTSTTIAPIHINGVGSTFTMTGGTVTIEREGGTGAQNLGLTITGVSYSTVTGGILQIGNSSTPATQTMNINSSVSIGGLQVNSANATAILQTNSLTVVNDISITSGILNANNLNFTLGGNWSDLGTFTPGSGTVTFNGTTQSIIKTTGEVFNNVVLSGTGAKILGGNLTTNGSLTINSGATFDVSASNYAVNVRRNWINNGTFNAQNGIVTFNGSVAQTLSGTATTFNQLDINNSSGGVSITSGNYVLNGVITPINGNFNTGGNNFTMVSNATQTARIAPVATSASLSGNFTVQRFVTARDTSYADLSSPVQTTSVLDWDNELPAMSYVYNPPWEYPSAYTYDESTDVYVPITNSTSTIAPGKGLEVFLAGDYSYSSLPNTTFNTIGVPNQGTQNLSGLISNDVQGWNLVGNPFASSISWASVYSASGGASSGLYDFIEMYDYTIGDWNGYTSADAIEIGSSQGFWVYGLPGATVLNLTIPESAKTTSSNSTIKAPSNILPYFSLKIESPANAFAHTFKVVARADASNDFDVTDLPFRASPNKATPALYSVVGDKKINLNAFNSFSESHSMPLTLKVSAFGAYKISAFGFDFIDDYKCIQLEDKKLNLLINLTSQNVYEFEMNVLEDKNRFVLHFNKNKDCKQTIASQSVEAIENNTVEVLPYNGGNLLNFNYSENTSVLVSVVNLLGQDIISKNNLIVEKQSEVVVLPDTFHGIYFIKISSSKGDVTKKFYKN